MLRKTLLATLLATTCSSAMAAGEMIPTNGLKGLVLKDEHIEVVLEDGYAVTRVHQVFHNPNPNVLEANYSFPVPDKASVGEFAYYIDGKPVFGEVLEKTQARKVYEDQKAKGNETALLEKDDYKTFDMKVYPVEANGDVRVQLAYFQPVKVDSGIGRYLFPMENSLAHAGTDNFWKNDKGNYAPYSFSFDLIIKNDYPIDQVKIPNYTTQKSKTEDGHWKIHIDNGVLPYSKMRSSITPLDPALNDISAEFDSVVDGGNGADNATSPENSSLKIEQPLDSDVVVYFKHKENLPGDLKVTFEKDGDVGTFMAVLTPANDLKPITEGRDWVFVLDKSGSMGNDIQTLATGVELALEKLTPNDRFQLVWFDSQLSNMTNRQWVNATSENVAKYKELLSTVRASGGTNVYGGMKEGLDQFDEDRTGAMILVTDGVANVGITERKEFFQLMKDTDVRLFTFVIGNSANKPLLEPVTKHSNGYAVNVSNADEIVGVVKLALDKATHEAYHGVKFEVDSKSLVGGVKAFNSYPENIGTLYKGQQLIVMGKYTGSGKATVSMTGKVSGEDKVYEAEIDFPEKATENPELERLWAYSSIDSIKNSLEFVGAPESNQKDKITEIALKYGLVTNYTSMIVVKDDEFEKLNIERTNLARIEKEHSAQALRQQSNAKPLAAKLNMKVSEMSHVSSKSKADPSLANTSGDTFDSSSSSSSSGGSFGWLTLLLLLPLTIVRGRIKRD